MSSTTSKKITATADDVFDRYEAKANAAFEAALKAAAARDKARSDAADLRQRLAHGDATVTAADLTAADAECERAELLSRSADSALAWAKAHAPVQPTLANAIVDAVAVVLRVPVEVVENVPTGTPDKLPVAFLRQLRPSKHDAHEGHLSGQVDVAYVRTDLHANVDAGKLEKKLIAAGYRLEANDLGIQTIADGIEVQNVRLVIESAYPEIPAIKGDPQDFRVRVIGSALAGAISERSRTIGGEDKPTASVNGFANLVSVTEDDGVRHVVVQVSIGSTSSKRWYTLSEMATHVKSEIEATAGKVFAGVGRCQSVDLEGVATYSGNSVHAKAKLTFVSKIAA